MCDDFEAIRIDGTKSSQMEIFNDDENQILHDDTFNAQVMRIVKDLADSGCWGISVGGKSWRKHTEVCMMVTKVC